MFAIHTGNNTASTKKMSKQQGQANVPGIVCGREAKSKGLEKTQVIRPLQPRLSCLFFFDHFVYMKRGRRISFTSDTKTKDGGAPVVAARRKCSGCNLPGATSPCSIVHGNADEPGMVWFTDTHMCETCRDCELCMTKAVDEIYLAWNYGAALTHLCANCCFWCVQHDRWETREVMERRIPSTCGTVGICDAVCSRCGGRARLPRLSPQSKSICVPCAAAFVWTSSGMKEKAHSI